MLATGSLSLLDNNITGNVVTFSFLSRITFTEQATMLAGDYRSLIREDRWLVLDSSFVVSCLF